MKQNRWYSIDVLRIVSFLLILLYHYMVELEAGGFLALSEMGVAYENSNLHMAKIGVTLFFMLSGFGLMYSSFSGFSLKEYAKKRCVRILIPYYVVSVLVFLAGMLVSAGALYEQPVPAWRIIFTILGLDGYLKEYGVLTFHLGVGEWFVGCLIFMYLIFPLLKRAMDWKPEVTMGAAVVCYLVITAVYRGSVPSHYFFPIKLFDFIVGMYFAVRLKKPVKKYALFSGIASLLLLIAPWNIPIDKNYLNVLICICLFLTVFHLEASPWIRKISKNRLMSALAGYSYEMFLIHHWAIIVMNRLLKPRSLAAAVLCFVLEAGVILVGSGVIHEGLKRLERTRA